MNVEADMKIQLSFIKPDTFKKCKNTKQHYSSQIFVIVVLENIIIFPKNIVYANILWIYDVIFIVILK